MRSDDNAVYDSQVRVDVTAATVTVLGNGFTADRVTVERDGATVYCTALFFDGEKGLVAKHRKLMPTGAERLIWGFGDGSTMPVIDTPLGRIGAVICWENYMPMLRMAMYDQGITLYCAPTADDRDGWASTMRHIALARVTATYSAFSRFDSTSPFGLMALLIMVSNPPFVNYYPLVIY